jgi:hypothetical protein
MNVIKNISISRFFAQAIFLLLPTIFVGMFILINTNQYYSFLQEQWFSQTGYFAIGLVFSYFLYQFRIRFLPTFVVIILALYSVYKIIDNFTIGEFDSFFISTQFVVFSYLFVVGWLFGWALQRISFSPLIISGLLLLASIILISKTGEITVLNLLQSFSPIALYAIYMIYTYESLKNTEQTNGAFWWKFSKRFILFFGFLFLIFSSVIYILYPQIKERTEEYGGQSKEGENDLLKNNKDGTTENKNSMGLKGNNKRNNNPEPLFCAHIESTLPNSDIPNPLYLTSYHFGKFDTLTETFERDTTISFSDEFVPNPSSIPLFFTYKDSSRIKHAMGTKNKKVVEVEIYKKRLSPSAFIAPSTAFWVQPITVEKDFQKEFSSGYRSKSYVSDLNSAYFIYNVDNPEIVQFQQQRFETLRKAKSNNLLSDEFMNYYTSFPSTGQYTPIKRLADSLAKGKITTIDKILSVRDYFLQRNELGEKVYSYTDNPGIPGLPGASKLIYFLFENKKGYCAYYAAATVFLLRSMHIPSRVVTGFLTVDRSDKNKGWYWFYEDQSHGWVQVYFPEYGWIDFDTTVGNDEAQQSPKPDGTPPMQPPNAIFAGIGKMISIDTIKRLAQMRLTHLVFKDVEYEAIKKDISLDLKVTQIWKDSILVNINQLKKGDDVMVVSYAEKLKQFSTEKNALDLLNKLPTNIPTDEIYIKDLSKEITKQKETQKDDTERPFTYYIQRILIGLLLLSIFILMLPYFSYQFYKLKIKTAKTTKSKSYFSYKAATFLLHQLQVERKQKTFLQFAKQVVDVRYKTSFEKFMLIYLKEKFANQTLSNEEASFVSAFYPIFEKSMKAEIALKTRFIRFFNLNRYIKYFFTIEE